MSQAFQFGALVGREKNAVTLMELLLSPAVGAAAGSALGGATAPKGHGLEGARRGAGRGAATTLGGTVGGMLGTAAGKALVNPVADMLIRNKHFGMAAGAMKALPHLGTALGTGLGGLAGYHGAGKTMGPASYDKKANVYDAGQATSQISPKPCCTNKSNIGQLTGQVSSNNPGQQGKSASYAARMAAMKVAGISEYAGRVPFGLAAGTGIGALAGLATSRKGKRLRGIARGALLGGGTGLGVDLGAALGVLPGMGLGAGAGALGGAAVGAGGGYLAGHRGQELGETAGLGALGGAALGLPVGGLTGLIGGGYMGGRFGNKLVRKALDKHDDEDE